AVADSCAEQARCAAIMTTDRYPASSEPLWTGSPGGGHSPAPDRPPAPGGSSGPHYSVSVTHSPSANHLPSTNHSSGAEHSRIRVAYVSADSREHAVSYLMAGVLEQHARSRFEVMGVSLAPAASGSPTRGRVMKACEQLHDVSRLTDRDAAGLLRE